MTLTTLIRESEALPVLVSLPKNDIELAKAAIRGGAAGVKVHLNAHHRASGSVFGTFQEELPFLKELSTLGVPLAIMVGQEVVPTLPEMNQLGALGFQGFNLYLHHLQPWLLEAPLRPILALPHAWTEEDMTKLLSVKDAWIEASIVDPSDYGKPLTEEDLTQYQEIVSRSKRPVIVPSQKKVTVEDVSRLKKAGVSALLVGVIVTGSTPETMEASVRSLVEASLALANAGHSST